MKTTWVLAVCLLLISSVAPAQVAEIGMHGGAFKLKDAELGMLDANTSLSLDDGWLLGFRLALNSYRYFGHEFGYSYNRTSLIVSQPLGEPEYLGTAIHRGFYNFLVYALPEGSVVRPFATGGGHFHTYVWPGYSAVSGGGATKFGFNYGGGVKVRITHMFGLRFDFRDYWNGKPFDLYEQRGNIQHRELSAGFSLLL